MNSAKFRCQGEHVALYIIVLFNLNILGNHCYKRNMNEYILHTYEGQLGYVV